MTMRDMQELSGALRSAPDLESFWDLCHAALQRYGVSSIFYGAMATRRELTHRRISRSLIWKTTHRREFIDAFGVETLLDDDYTVEHCVNRPEVLFWHEDDSWRSSSPKQRERARIERDLGFRIGVTVPARHFAPGHIGGVGVAMQDVAEGEFTRFWRYNGKKIVTICGLLDAGMREQHMGELVGLSPRERECLTWIAAGLMPTQIADRLAISDKCVEKYIAGAKTKLKAATRDHAVAKAIMLGLIDP